MKKIGLNKITIGIFILVLFGFSSVGFCANEAVVVDEQGNVGIGTDSPTQKLEVNGNIKLSEGVGKYGAGRIQTFSSGDLIGLTLNSKSRVWDLISITSSNPDYFAIRDNTARKNRLIIDNQGNVKLSEGVGKYGAGRIQTFSSGDLIGLTLNSTSRAWDLISITSSSTDYFGIRDNKDGKIKLKIEQNGNVKIIGSLTNSSDERLKENIIHLENSLDKISSLEGVSYNWIDKENGTDTQIGLIAQDVEMIYPELVSTDSEGYKSLAYSKLVAPLVEAVKELKKENDELKARLEKIEAALNMK